MIEKQLQKLKKITSTPCISVVIPTEKKFPDSEKNPIKMKNAIKELENLLNEKFSKREVKSYLEKIHNLEESIDYAHTLNGLGLFVSENIAEIVHIPFDVQQGVFVDSSFQIRDLIYTLNRRFKYKVLLLSEEKTRVFYALDEEITEYFPPDLPKGKDSYVDEPVGDDTRFSYKDVKLFNKNIDARYLQDVDEFISKHYSQEQNLVLVGVEEHFGEFNKMTKNESKILLQIHGNYDHASEAELSELIWPKILEKLQEDKGKILSELEEAVSAGKYASGLSQVWREAFMGKAHKVLVEKNYLESARKGEDEYTIYTDKLDSSSDDYISDAVDDLVEEAIAHGGEVLFFEEGDLEKHQKIAVITRY